MTKVYDDNLNSILSLLNINNTKIFLGGDLENTEKGKEDLYAPLIGKVDVMKFNHHVETTKSNTKNFVNTLDPKYIIKTGIRPVEEQYKKYLDSKDIKILNAGLRDKAAVVLEFNNGKVTDVSNEFTHYGFYHDNNVLKFKDWNGEFPKKDWYQHNDSWYYFKENGLVSTKWQQIDGAWFYFNEDGSLKEGLFNDNNHYYYIDKNKGMLTNTFKDIADKTIFLKSNGQMAKDEWENFRHFENDGSLSKNKWIGLIFTNNEGQIFNIKNLPLAFVTILILILVFRKVRLYIQTSSKLSSKN